MSMDNVTCFAPGNEYVESFEKFQLAWFSVNVLVMVTSLGVWFKLCSTKGNQALKKRSLTHICLMCVSWILFLMHSSLIRGTSFQGTCFLIRAAAEEAGSLALVVQSLRLWKWRNMIQYNKALSASFEHNALQYYTTGERGQKSYSQATHSEQEEEQVENFNQLEYDLQQASQNTSTFYTSLVTAVAVLILSLIVALSAQGNCIGLSISELCIFKLESDQMALAVSIMFSLCMTVVYFLVSIQREKTKNPDPFEFLSEIKWSLVLYVISVCAFIYFGETNSFETNADGKIKFDKSVISEAFVTLFYAQSVVYPLIKFKLLASSAKGNQPLKLEEVLESEVGIKLFRSHLIYEFGVENLNFYEVVCRWRRDFQDMSTTVQRTAARNIYSRWISSQDSSVNIGFLTGEKLKKKLGNKEIEMCMFDEAVDEVVQMLKYDAFPRFCQSKEYREFIGLGSVYAAHI